MTRQRQRVGYHGAVREGGGELDEGVLVWLLVDYLRKLCWCYRLGCNYSVVTCGYTCSRETNRLVKSCISSSNGVDKVLTGRVYPVVCRFESHCFINDPDRRVKADLYSARTFFDEAKFV